MHFLVLRKKLVSYFASIKRGVTTIFNYQNILQLMTTRNSLLSKLRRKKMINFESNDQFSEPFWHSYRPESAGNSVSRLLDLKIFWESMPPDPHICSRLRRSRIFPVPSQVVPTSVSPQVGHSALCIIGNLHNVCIVYHSNIKIFGPGYWGTHPPRKILATGLYYDTKLY